MSEFVPVEFHEVVTVGDDPEAAVKQFIDEAAAMRASDLFFTSEASGVLVRVRHMGVMKSLHELSVPDGRRCMNFVKTAAGMDLSERRRPTDGRWIYTNPDGAQRYLRINTIPTLHGEDFCLRLLGQARAGGKLEELGLTKTQFHDLHRMLRNQGGLILVTGPTGAGKTTTLYGCLHYLNDGTKKLNTIEDPIECEIPGVRQSQVETAIGLDFPELLRGVLRQAPDVILIGEIRDAVTAQTAIRAANSGQLVVATMHAPVAVAAVRAILNYDVRSHFLASCLLGILAQRLVRVLCPRCRTSVDPSTLPMNFEEIRPWIDEGEGSVIYGHVGCQACNHTGYVDRTGVFELLSVNAKIRRLISDGGDDKEIFDEALSHGMIDFRRAGLLKIAQGATTLEELFRVVPAEYLAAER